MQCLSALISNPKAAVYISRRFACKRIRAGSHAMLCDASGFSLRSLRCLPASASLKALMSVNQGVKLRALRKTELG
jgi:hypothetical protein